MISEKAKPAKQNFFYGYSAWMCKITKHNCIRNDGECAICNIGKAAQKEIKRVEKVAHKIPVYGPSADPVRNLQLL